MDPETLHQDEVLEIINEGTKNLPKFDSNGNAIDYDLLLDQKIRSSKLDLGSLSKHQKRCELWNLIK